MQAPIVAPDDDSHAIYQRSSPQLHGKSSHIAALRSLGLLHELQEYVTDLQCTAAEQQRQLNMLQGERREAQRGARRAGLGSVSPPPRSAASLQQGHSTPHFAASEVVDLPPRLRALVEDNKARDERGSGHAHAFHVHMPLPPFHDFMLP